MLGFGNITIRVTAIVLLMLAIGGITESFGQEESPSVSLTTDKESYLPGDTVHLSGVITGQEGPLVGIQVKDIEGNLILIRTVQAAPNGDFAVQFKIPSTSTSGDFTITASARINGLVVTQTKTMTAIVPEFGFMSILVLCLSVIFMVVMSSLRMKRLVKF